eukprot:6066592-Amphidinium_carterae.2
MKTQTTTGGSTDNLFVCPYMNATVPQRFIAPLKLRWQSHMPTTAGKRIVADRAYLRRHGKRVTQTLHQLPPQQIALLPLGVKPWIELWPLAYASGPGKLELHK